MWSSALRSSAMRSLSSTTYSRTNNLSHASIFARCLSSPINNNNKINKELLSLSEVEKILKDVGADDIRVIPSSNRCEFTDCMVVATGRSPWHVRNIAQALIYKVKQKQQGAKRMLLPSVVGQEGGKWVVIDSGTLIVHAVDEKARAYYNLEGLWSSDTSDRGEATQDLDKAFVKVRRKNNSKKPSQASASI